MTRVIGSKIILLRADGNQHIGLGHLFRLIALNEMLEDQYRLIFLTRDLDILMNELKYRKETFQIPETIAVHDEPNFIAERFDSSNHLIAIDGYTFDDAYQRQLKKHGFKIVFVDDLAQFRMCADLVINHALGSKEKDYSKEDYTHLALGSDYALVRSRFIQSNRKEKKTGTNKNVFICFGGADPLDLSLQIIKGILGLEARYSLKVLVGASYMNQAIFDFNEERISVYRNLNQTEMYDVMSDCDLAVTSSSTIAYEVCFLKIPLMIGWYAENQKRLYQNMISSGLAKGLGDLRSINEKIFRRQFEKFATEDNQQIVESQSKYFDGKSPERIRKLIGAL